MKEIRLQAHRGVSTEAPENTLSAFRAAVVQGYDIIELDPKFTGDGVCVALHDSTLNRTCRLANGDAFPRLAISDITLEEARAFDAGILMGEQFKGEVIPTLSETLDLIKNSPIHCKIDNVWETFTAEQQDSLISQVRDADLKDKAGFTCRTLQCFEKAAKRLPECELHWDGALNDETLEAVKIIGKGHRLTLWARFDNTMTSWSTLPPATPELCEKIRPFGEVGVWILSTEEELERAVTHLSPDVIETTGSIKPHMLRKYN